MAEHPLKEQFFSHFGIEPRITSCTQYSVCVCGGGGGGGGVSVSQAQHGSPQLDQTQGLYLESLSLKK